MNNAVSVALHHATLHTVVSFRKCELNVQSWG